MEALEGYGDRNLREKRALITKIQNTQCLGR